jgi:hypothetical protein
MKIMRLERTDPRMRALVLNVSVEPLASASLPCAGTPLAAELRDRPDRLIAPPKHSGIADYTPSPRTEASNLPIALREIRETCICETPIFAPIARWGIPCSNRSPSTIRSRAVNSAVDDARSASTRS